MRLELALFRVFVISASLVVDLSRKTVRVAVICLSLVITSCPELYEPPRLFQLLFQFRMNVKYSLAEFKCLQLMCNCQ